MKKGISIFFVIIFILSAFRMSGNNVQYEKFDLFKGYNSSLNKLIHYSGQFEENISKGSKKTELQQVVNIIVANNILRDMEILSYDDYTGKIFGRTFAKSHIVETHTKNSFGVFQTLDDVLLLPYDNGQDGKVLALDGAWNTIFFMGEDVQSSGINHYGERGTGPSQFSFPTGICYGREYQSGSTTIYPVYICDNSNNRISKVNFEAKPPQSRSDFDGNSFTVLNSHLYSPFDISYFMVSDTAKYDDKLWVSEIGKNETQFISCLRIDGTVIQQFVGYKDNETGLEVILSGMNLPRIACFYGSTGVNALSIIDNINNRIIFCLIDEEGEGEEYLTKGNQKLIVATHFVQFPEQYPVNSVFFQETDNQLSSIWTNVWVTSGYAPPYFNDNISMVHLLKMNKHGGTQYLGSSYRPRNSDLDFKKLTNLALARGFYDIYTIEKWDNNYGIRKYLPYADIHSDTLLNYCADSLNRISLRATFTNDCWIYLTAQRKNRQGNWESVKIKKINNNIVDNFFAVKYQLAGWNQADDGLYVNIQLDLPIVDISLGGEVRLGLKLYPEWADENNLSNFPYSVVEKYYEVDVVRSCLPRPGGCPFLYVKDENGDYIPDNNVLHRMEFSSPQTNITDKYKLRITPKITNNAIETYLVENENDSAFIDQVKLYAVDFPSTRKLGITEDNLIVIYDSATVTASDTVLLNTSDITNNVHFHHPGSVLTSGASGDSIYSHYLYSSLPLLKNRIKNSTLKNSKQNENRAVSKDNFISRGDSPSTIAFITELQNLVNPVPQTKDTAGLLSALSIYENPVDKIFARRELSSVVIVPLFNDTDLIKSVNINWQSDFRMKYLGAVSLHYSGFTSTEMPMINGSYITTTDEVDITGLLTSENNEYGLVTSSGLLKMTFNTSQLPAIPLGYTREYVIDVTGFYNVGVSLSPSDNKVTNIPLTYSISQNYPNPFNPVTKINYELPRNSFVKIIIYDILGRELIRLVNNEFKETGRYTVEFDGKSFASGVYFYKIEAGDFVVSKKMVLVK